MDAITTSSGEQHRRVQVLAKYSLRRRENGSPDELFRSQRLEVDDGGEFSRRMREREEVDKAGDREIERPNIKLHVNCLETKKSFGLNLRPKNKIWSQICDRSKFRSPFATELAGRSPSLRLSWRPNLGRL